MGIFKRKNNIRAAADTTTEKLKLNSTFQEINSFFGGDVSINASKLTSATYYACMLIRCNSIAKLPLLLKKKDSKGTVDLVENNLYDLLKTRPNNFMTAHDFLWASEFQRLEYGNAYWVQATDNKGNITAIYLLDSRNVTIMIDDLGILDKKNSIYYIYQDPRKGQMIFTADDIIHFKNFATDALKGRGVKHYLYDLISNEQYATNVIKNKYQTGLQDPLIVEYIGDLSDAMTTKIKNKFASLGGVKNAGKVVPIPSEFKVNQLESKLVNNQFFELQGLTSIQIANAFGVKPFQLSQDIKTAAANVEQQNKAFYSDTLQDVLITYEQEINYKMLSKKERQTMFIKFDADSILRSSLESRTEAYTKAINAGYMTIAEVREREDLTYIEGTDRLIIGNGASIPLKDLGKQYNAGGE